jgi:hypothetical protein
MVSARTEEQRRSTAARACLASILDTNTAITHKQMNQFAVRAQSKPAMSLGSYCKYIHCLQKSVSSLENKEHSLEEGNDHGHV